MNIVYDLYKGKYLQRILILVDNSLRSKGQSFDQNNIVIDDTSQNIRQHQQNVNRNELFHICFSQLDDYDSFLQWRPNLCENDH